MSFLLLLLQSEHRFVEHEKLLHFFQGQLQKEYLYDQYFIILLTPVII